MGASHIKQLVDAGESTPAVQQLAIRLFAMARQVAGASSVHVQVPQPARVADVRKAISVACPRLAPMVPQMLIAVDSEYADDDTPVTRHNEIACIPPVSGG